MSQSCFVKIDINKAQHITATTDLGNRLNGKMVLYLKNLCLTEKSRIFNPQPRQAPECWQQGFYTNLFSMSKENILPNLYKLTIGNFSAVVAIIMAIYYFIKPGEEGWGILIAIYLSLFGILMFAFDFIIQRFRIKYIVVNVIELLILIAVASLFKT